MPTLTFDPSSDQPTAEQLQVETAALEQGEKLAQAAEEDRQRLFNQQDSENQNLSLIGGKFKSQDDLLRAYRELESKLGKNANEEDGEDAEEPPSPSTDDVPQVEESSETVNYMLELGRQYDQTGELPEEAIERLSQMDQKELIKSYLQYQQQVSSTNQQASLQAEQINAIKQSVGGDAAYAEMTSWAAENLSPREIEDYNAITNSGNPVAIKFAVEAMSNRFRSAEGYEAPLVTGRKGFSGPKPYRSQAELARDIANPMYHNDPGFRADVEDRLARSKDLL
jgi:hypothetical protein